VLQLLVVQAAADGNAAMLSLLLPLFEKMGWLVSAFLLHTPLDAAFVTILCASSRCHALPSSGFAYLCVVSSCNVTDHATAIWGRNCCAKLRRS